MKYLEEAEDIILENFTKWKHKIKSQRLFSLITYFDDETFPSDYMNVKENSNSYNNFTN